MINPVQKLYLDLRRKHRKITSQWSLWCKRPKNSSEREEVVIGAILAQRVNWRNVEQAISNLKMMKKNSLSVLAQSKPKELFKLLKPTGFYKTKTEYLLGVAKFIVDKYGDIRTMKKENLSKLRKELLGLKGIGPETADDILLYALDKPVFVIDEYTKRIAVEENFSDNLSYLYLQHFFEKHLPRDYALFQDFHALIVIEGKIRQAEVRRRKFRS